MNQASTSQDILNNMAESMIANSNVYLPYMQIGRSVATIERNLRLLGYLYIVFPYFNQTTPEPDISAAQQIINLTQL